jgi:hypothetical protein
MEEPQFVLNTTTLAAIGGIMGVLTGAISFLTRQLLKSKNDQIRALEKDRDFYREHVMVEIEGSSLNATQERGPAQVHGRGIIAQEIGSEDACRDE